jgi:IclR family transcriptional regulator, acetate operon repressor
VAEPSGGVQAIDRVLDLLDRVARADGPRALSELAAETGLAAPTAHRLMRALLRHGYVRQEPSRRYALGPRLIYLGERAARTLGDWAVPQLTRLRDATGETANLALLDGDEIVYVTQAPSRHQMRMFTEPGRRVLPHCTAVGKALLAGLPDDEVRALLARTGMPAHTPNTITEPDALLAALAEVRERGYASDDGEQEIGVRCLGVAVPTGSARMAVSVSGPHGRLTDAAVRDIVARLREVATELGARLP